MKKLITSVFILICTSVVVAQNVNDDYYHAPKSNFLSKDKVSGSMSMGAGVSFLNSTKSSAYTTFIAPKIGYQLSNKFKLNLGLMHYSIAGNTFMGMNQNEALYNNRNKTITGNLLFVEGQYQLNKKVLLSGAVMMDANNFSNKQANFKAISMGMDYKVSEHSSIGFRASISEGTNSPYYNTHMGTYNFGSNTAPMHDMFVGFGQGVTQGLNSIIH